MEAGKLPATVWMVLTLAAITVAVEVVQALRRGEASRIPRAILGWGVLPALPCLLAWSVAGTQVPTALAITAAVMLVIPIAPLVARLALQPIADASVLVLLIASLALHFLLSGMGLLFFGPEGFRTSALVGGVLTLPGGLAVNGQVLLMVSSAIVLSGLFFLAFERTVAGKALRATAVNRVGARLVGIRPTRTALWAYTFSSLLAGLIGILIAPVMTMYYDSGFLIGLKAFVAAIIGGLVSYPLTAVGGIAVGMVESFGSFFSGALKDLIVFCLLIPALLLRSALQSHPEEEQEEVEA